MRVVSFSVPFFIFGAMTKNNKYGLRRAPINLKGRKTENKPAVIIGGISLVWGAAYVNSYIVSLIPGFSDALEDLTGTGSDLTVLQIILAVISTALIPAIFEELLYRGLVLGNLIPFGRGFAVVFSALMFGIMHQNPAQLFYATAAGLVLGYVYIKTESFLMCVIIHFINNFISVLQDVLNDKLEEMTAYMVNSAISAFVMIVGFSCIIFLLFKKAKDEKKDDGSFGVILPASEGYEEISVPTDKKLFSYFSAPVIVFTVYCFVSVFLSVLTVYLNNYLNYLYE